MSWYGKYPKSSEDPQLEERDWDAEDDDREREVDQRMMDEEEST